MVHIFQFKADTLAYDTESQALLELDQLAAACLKAFIDEGGKRPTEETVEAIGAACDVSLLRRTVVG